MQFVLGKDDDGGEEEWFEVGMEMKDGGIWKTILYQFMHWKVVMALTP